jgi:hypothetical protein
MAKANRKLKHRNLHRINIMPPICERAVNKMNRKMNPMIFKVFMIILD